MATIRMADLGNLMLAGCDEIFNKAASAPRRQYWKEICREVQQDKRVGNYDTVGCLGPANEHSEETPIVFDKMEAGLRTNITSKVYEKGVKASLEAQEFDLYDVIEQQFGEPLVNVLNNKKERLVAAIYNNAFTATGIDGVALCADAHPLLSNANLFNDNLITGALSPETIKAGKNRFNHIYDMAGEYFDTQATHLLIHPNKAFQVYEILNSALMAWELSNTKNSVGTVGGKLAIIENRYIDYDLTTDASKWFMLDKGLARAGVTLQKKKGLTLKTWFENDDLSLKGIAYEIYGVGCTAPGYGFVGSTGA